MMSKTNEHTAAVGDITDDFLLCNRCGACRAVCPLFLTLREEWTSARGKVELAETFFRGERIEDAELRRIFDLCLHCQTCEEHCPSGMRADEIVMAVRAEMARRGLIPRVKRLALRALEGMDNALFKLMRAVGLVRRAPLHGVGGRSPLRLFFPLLGWPRERFVPLLRDKPFLSAERERYDAAGLDVHLPDPDAVERGELPLPRSIDPAKASDLVRRIAASRERNLSERRCAYYYVGHTVNHFFPEEAEAVVWMLNLLGVDVIAPRDQVCCGAPIFYAGDIEGARRAAYAALETFSGKHYDWVVTTCSSGGHMLKAEFPRLFDLTTDGFFKIEWDSNMEAFRRIPGRSGVAVEYPRAADLYREYIEGKIYDINELLVELLDLHEISRGFDLLFSEGAAAEETPQDTGRVVTYHHPCHLNRGQSVNWQPEKLLKILPGYRYVQMPDAERCCGGGGTFTFQYGEESEAVAEVKMSAVAAVQPDVLATACPLCRIQLMDMLQRRQAEPIPVKSPVELLCEELAPLAGTESARE